MTPHEYLVGVLADQQLSAQTTSQLQTLRGEIEATLRDAYGAAPRMYYGGSYGKKTMISAAFDLDIVMYFPSTNSSTLQQIYNSVYSTLTNARYIVTPKTVALSLPYDGGFHIDVVPGKAQTADFQYATLFKNCTPPSTMQTSLKVHIDAARRFKDVIKLIKLWRVRHGIDVKTLVLELLVARALYGQRVADLGSATWTVLEFIRDNVNQVRLVDPANSNNVIEVGQATRNALQRSAAASCQAQDWNQIVW